MDNEKRCITCGEVKPLSAFYKHSKMKDGHLNKCKDCARMDARKRELRLESDGNWVKKWVKKEKVRGREKHHSPKKKSKIILKEEDMDDKKIEKEGIEFWDSSITVEEATGYIQDICGSIIGEDPYPPEKILGVLRFALEEVSSSGDYDKVMYHYGIYKHEHDLYKKKEGQVLDIIEIVEYIEDRVLSLVSIYREPITRAEFFLNIKNTDHEYVLARHAVVKVLMDIDVELKVKDMMSRYEMTHCMKSYIEKRFTPEAMAINKSESNFVNLVNKIPEEINAKIKESDIFGANLKTK